MLKHLIHKKINEVFLEYQKANNIVSGDIRATDARALDMFEDYLAEFVERVCSYQLRKSSVKKNPASFYIYRDAEEITHSVTYEHIDTDKFFCEISKRYAFDDCSGEDIVAIFWRGKEVEYAGWQPCMRFEYKDLNGNTVWVGQFEHWDH